MPVEHSAAFPFIFQDDLYLSARDSAFINTRGAGLPTIKTPPVKLNHLGQNGKGFLIVVYYPDENFIKNEHLTALQSILKRMEFNLEDVAIFNLAKQPLVKFTELTGCFNPNKLLLLGKLAIPSDTEAIILNIPVILKNISTLYSFSFDEMMDNTANKKLFWEQVKQL